MPCRCLLNEARPDLGQVVADYVALLREEEKTPPDAYRARLNACLKCEKLRDGTCALCGCYVEARAAKRGMGCPAVPPKWRRLPKEAPAGDEESDFMA